MHPEEIAKRQSYGMLIAFAIVVLIIILALAAAIAMVSWLIHP